VPPCQHSVLCLTFVMLRERRQAADQDGSGGMGSFCQPLPSALAMPRGLGMFQGNGLVLLALPIFHYRCDQYSL